MKEQNINLIKNKIYKYFPQCEIILFGSRATGNFNENSDYDILIIINKNLHIKKRRKFAHLIRKELAKFKLPVDIIIKNVKQIKKYNQNSGYIVDEAIINGIRI